MKNNLVSGSLLTILSLVIFSGLYTGIVWVIALMAPGHGKGEMIFMGDKKFYKNIGQDFSEDIYFYSRPSAVDYNAAGSGGSNKGPSNEAYLQTVQQRADTFLLHNPGIKKEQVPSELVTASGSGLDPHISVQAANIQVKRIASLRHIPEEKIYRLVKEHTEKPFLSVFGTEKINVLALNIALDQLDPGQE